MQLEVDRVKTESSVDAQVNGLKTLKGDEKTDRSESTVDDQTQQLNRLKQRREQEEATPDDEETLGSFLERLAARLGF